MTIHQISVFLENRAGQLAEISNILANNGIDLRAINIAETADYGVLRLIVCDAHKASAILLEQGFILTMTPVTAVTVDDEPGALAKLLKLLAENDIGIEYMYSIFGHADGKAHIIFRVVDSDKMADLLSANGYQTSTAEDLGIR
ncbi:MAG: ACT domain-containing protein [Clostridia bacterium]|nr:ACT domain-containing protein [Clostridia bacterium]MBR4955294.1 ACT domain-containing protein [Clostridia bacterium]MBR5903751.1 ACT domain-containing protein [Clostridia bacterium]